MASRTPSPSSTGRHFSIQKWLILGGLIGVPLFFAVTFIVTRPNRYQPLPVLAEVVSELPRGADGTIAVILSPDDTTGWRLALQLHFFLAQTVTPSKWSFTLVTPSLSPAFAFILAQQEQRHGWAILHYAPDTIKEVYPPHTVWLIDRTGAIRGRYSLSSPLLHRRVREDIQTLYYEYAHPEQFVR